MKVGIIGCGLVGRKRASALGDSRLVACADLVRERAETLARAVPGQVQVLTEDRRSAEALAIMLKVPATAISDLPTPNAAADIRIVVGQDFRIPPTS